MTVEKQVEEQQIVINEEAPVVEKEISLEGLLPEEVEMAKKHGLVKEPVKEEKADVKHDEQQHVEGDKVSEEEKAKIEETKPDFEDAEKAEQSGDKSLVNKYTVNEKAFYRKWKMDKKQRQEAQSKYEELKAQSELGSIKDKVAQQKLKKAVDLLKDPNQELTVDKLLAVIGDEDVDSDDKKTLTVADLKKYEEDKSRIYKEQEATQLKNQERMKVTEDLGRTKNSKFEDIVKLASEIASTKKAYSEMLGKAFLDTSIDEEELVEMIFDIAKLNPKFKDLESGEPEVVKDEVVNKNIERAINNSSKKTSSAAVGGSKAPRIVSESQLTVTDAARLSSAEWMKLKPETRKRLLMSD